MEPSRPARITSLHAILGGFAFAGGITAVIGWTAGALTSFDTVGPTEPFAYPWRLREPNDAARVTAWAGYALHNLAAWLVIAMVRRRHLKYASSFRWPNVAMLIVHVGFALLHVVQTQIWYDGLARDVPEVTALGSVALMLMVVLALENPRRGLVLGKRVTFPRSMVQIVREYHGYLFTWALIYTFWYHPTEATAGHLVGFFYLLLLLWQSVLVMTRAHLDRRWTLALEILVIPHAVVVAWLQGKGLWPMFLFGFTAVFVLTQMYAFDWPSLVRRLIWGGYVLAVVIVYGQMDRFAAAHEVLRIPVLDYGVVGLLAAVFWLIDRTRLRGRRQSPTS